SSTFFPAAVAASFVLSTAFSVASFALEATSSTPILILSFASDICCSYLRVKAPHGRTLSQNTGQYSPERIAGIRFFAARQKRTELLRFRSGCSPGSQTIVLDGIVKSRRTDNR